MLRVPYRFVMLPLARLIDANANRAREGLRVLEDLARFVLHDQFLAAACKSLRHTLSETVEQLPLDRAHLLAWRESASDVGTRTTTGAEVARTDLSHIAAAAAGRLTEALRAIEEAAKALDAPDPARQFERLRYLAYDSAAAIERALGTGRAQQWRLCVLLTESLCTHHPWQRVAELAIAGGADCLQLREKTLDAAELAARVRTLVEIARPHHVPIILNDRPDIALAAGADGVHLGQHDLSIRDTRRLVGNGLLIGCTAATLANVRAAAAEGADYCGLGPIFSSTTKPKPTLAGLDLLRDHLADPATARLPHLAISGITPANIAQLASVGCRGVAVSSAVCSTDDPASACTSLLASMTSWKSSLAEES